MCKSVCFPMWFRPSPQEIVLGRLTRVIRRLFEAIAGYSLFVMVGNCTILSGGRYLQIFLSFVRHIDAPFAVSANPTKDHSKTSRSRRNEQSIPQIMKNERPKPNTPTETQATSARTQIAAQHSELASNDSTGNRNPKSLSTAAAVMPRRSG